MGPGASKVGSEFKRMNRRSRLSSAASFCWGGVSATLLGFEQVARGLGCVAGVISCSTPRNCSKIGALTLFRFGKMAAGPPSSRGRVESLWASGRADRIRPARAKSPPRSAPHLLRTVRYEWVTWCMQLHQVVTIDYCGIVQFGSRQTLPLSLSLSLSPSCGKTSMGPSCGL